MSYLQRCQSNQGVFYNDHELDYDLSEYAHMEVLDVVDFAIQKERDESIFGNPRIVTYHSALVLDVLIGGDKKENACADTRDVKD